MAHGSRRLGQPGRRATRRAVARANGLSVESKVSHEADWSGVSEDAKGVSST